MAIEVRKVVLESVSDASGLAALIDEGAFEADAVVAVIGKTEGNGGGTDGILTPHTTIFATVADDGPPSNEPRLAVGPAMVEVDAPTSRREAPTADGA